MKKTSIVAIVLSVFLMTTQQVRADVTITVTNATDVQRQELVEVDLATVRSLLALTADETFIVKNAVGQQVMTQQTRDGKLLLDVAVRPQGKAVFTVTPGTPQTFENVVCGRQYPERVDDIAWENDRTAYRIYGPALQASGERAFGVDVWVKNTPSLEVEKRYTVELSNHGAIEQLKAEGKSDEALALEQATTYHYDHGYGLDCYKVGPTLGGGAPALVVDGELLLPYCYKDYDILDNGPLRFAVHVSYNAVEAGQDKNVVEHRIISLDKGSNFNKVVVWYEGLTQPTDVAAGVVLHQEDLTSISLGESSVLYADPTDNPQGQNFQIYVGALFPDGVNETKQMMNAEPVNGNAGHAVGIATLQPGQRFTYYFGSAWSKNDVRTFDEWKLRAAWTLDAIKQPLTVTVE